MHAGLREESLATYSDLEPKDFGEGSGPSFLGVSPALLQAQMRDYSRSGDRQFVQRLPIYVVAIALAFYYYTPFIAISTAALAAVSEALDVVIHKAVYRGTSTDLPTVRRNFGLLVLSSALSSSIVVYFVLSIALLEPPAMHFVPLFLLLATSIFSAMNDNQVLFLLRVRLFLYGGAFLVIPILDIMRTGADLHTAEWKGLFTSIAVLLFIAKISQVFLDIYRRQLEQVVELRHQAEREKVSSRIKSEFLSTMSHELRTPMTSINGAVGLAVSGSAGPLTPKLKSLLTIAQTNCLRLSNLINDVLDLQKIEAGRMELKLSPIELGRFAEKSCEVNRPYADSLNVTFEAVVDTAAGPVTIEGDERRLDQVMSNLLSNAAKFSPPGSVVTVKLSILGTKARIEVIDRGVGLSEDKRSLVFDMFSQIDGSDRRKIAGTGLGMHISKQIVEAHGGVIDYRKNAGPGTTFHVDLPLQEA